MLLGVVECNICLFKEYIIIGAFKGSNTCTYCNRRNTILGRMLQYFIDILHLTHNAFLESLIEFGEEDNELITTVTNHMIRLAETVLQERSHFLQNIVTDIMTIGVIDRFEIIDIHDHDCHRPNVLRVFLLQTTISGTIECTGQMIMFCAILQLLFALLLFIDTCYCKYHLLDLTSLLILNRHHGNTTPALGNPQIALLLIALCLDVLNQ